jgi:hypothetical protein
MPKQFRLLQNYPNPFSAKGGSAPGGNPTTTIEYRIPASQRISGTDQIALNIADNVTVTLKVYDILGREVAVLVNENQRPGHYSVVFNAAGLPSGIYFYRLTAGNISIVKKLTLLK